MYFSRVTWMPSSAQRIPGSGLNDVYGEHRLLWQIFPEDPEQTRDFLYRRCDESPLQFYVLSKRKPRNDLTTFAIETKQFQPVIQTGERFQFQLRVNPVVTRSADGKRSKKRRRDDVYLDALARNRDLPEGDRLTSQEVLSAAGTQWLQARSERLGCTFNSVLVERYRRIQTAKKREHKITLGVMDFSGLLTVTDKERFLHHLLNGIGHGKAFGCGLLLIKRAI